MKVTNRLAPLILVGAVHLTASAYVVPPDFFNAFVASTRCERKGGENAIRNDPGWGWHAIAECERPAGTFGLLISAETDQFGILADTREVLQAAEAEFGVTPASITQSGRDSSGKFVVVVPLSSLPKIEQLAKTFRPPKIVRIMCMPALPNMGGMNALLAGVTERPNVFNVWYDATSQALYDDKAGQEEIKKYNVSKSGLTVFVDEETLFTIDVPSGALHIRKNGVPAGEGECSSLDGIYTHAQNGRERHGKMKI